MRKLADKTVHVAAIVPADLHRRLVRQTAKETADRGHTITPSQIIRWAIEDYLDMWETATFVPQPSAAKGVA
jgi:hypothetical protein